jgi:hypothetical protein
VLTTTVSPAAKVCGDVFARPCAMPVGIAAELLLDLNDAAIPCDVNLEVPTADRAVQESAKCFKALTRCLRLATIRFLVNEPDDILRGELAVVVSRNCWKELLEHVASSSLR